MNCTHHLPRRQQMRRPDRGPWVVYEVDYWLNGRVVVAVGLDESLFEECGGGRWMKMALG